MDAELFLADIEAKPAALVGLLDRLDEQHWPTVTGPVLLTGMGSSWFAADVAARRLRRAGVHAVAELASVEASWPPDPGLTVVAISASGATAETLAMLDRYRETSATVLLTNTPGPGAFGLHAGAELGGVACRTYIHTLVWLLGLEQAVTGVDLRLGERVSAAAAAIADLLDRRQAWLPAALDALSGDDGVWLLAPAERLGSALQGALMVREGPRRPADGCETGDWNHVDVYLTKTLDYRAILFCGSRFEGDAIRWMIDRRAQVLAVGGDPGGCTMALRYPGDDDPIVALLTEVLVAELIAAHWWLASSP